MFGIENTRKGSEFPLPIMKSCFFGRAAFVLFAKNLANAVGLLSIIAIRRGGFEASSVGYAM